jgi:hypothetical protein
MYNVLSQRKRILIVGMADSVHLARWLSQFVDQHIDFTLFPSSPHRHIHPKIKEIIASPSNQMTVTIQPSSMRWLALPLSALDIPFNNLISSTFSNFSTLGTSCLIQNWRQTCPRFSSLTGEATSIGSNSSLSTSKRLFSYSISPVFTQRNVTATSRLLAALDTPVQQCPSFQIAVESIWKKYQSIYLHQASARRSSSRVTPVLSVVRSYPLRHVNS